MAKRYVRLNWQNKPSVATPISAINLNIMDKGIDDLDLFKVDTDAIVNNGVTTVAGTVLDGRMGKTLTDGLTAINNNFAQLTMSVSSVTTDAALDTAFNGLHNNAPDRTWYRSVININASGLKLTTGFWYVEGFKVNSVFGWQKVTSYSSSGVLVSQRALFNSTWSNWVAK